MSCAQACLLRGWFGAGRVCRRAVLGRSSDRERLGHGRGLIPVRVVYDERLCVVTWLRDRRRYLGGAVGMERLLAVCPRVISARAGQFAGDERLRRGRSDVDADVAPERRTVQRTPSTPRVFSPPIGWYPVGGASTVSSTSARTPERTSNLPSLGWAWATL